jgi:hypothetical protein
VIARLAIAGAATLALAGMCMPCGGGDDATTTHRLDSYGISFERPSNHVGGPTTSGYAWTSSDGSSYSYVMPAPAGPPAAQRDPATLVPGVTSSTVQWSRPVTIDGMSGIEARVIETAPQARVHWIAALDAPQGTILLWLVTDQRWVTDPTFGDRGWTALKNGVHRL